jgi:D-serine deaminase-like pyridoxal phosphate-dependent protein
VPLPVPVAFPDIVYSHFGDEHGLLQGPNVPAVGASLDLIPAHCDPVVNLHEFLHVVRGNVLVDIWPIEARGTL